MSGRKLIREWSVKRPTRAVACAKSSAKFAPEIVSPARYRAIVPVPTVNAKQLSCRAGAAPARETASAASDAARDSIAFLIDTRGSQEVHKNVVEFGSRRQAQLDIWGERISGKWRREELPLWVSNGFGAPRRSAEVSQDQTFPARESSLAKYLSTARRARLPPGIKSVVPWRVFPKGALACACHP